MSDLKYKDKLETVRKKGCNCPPAESYQDTKAVYRWVCNPLTEECFVPQAIKNPRRVLNAKSIEDECSCWGLSLHTCIGKSKLAYKAVKANLPNADKIFGGFIAEGQLDNLSGLLTPPDKNGHFDLHPFTGFSGITTFRVVDRAI